jgi:hypothetical protein
MGSRLAASVFVSVAMVLAGGASGAAATSSVAATGGAARAAASSPEGVALAAPVSQTPVSYTPNVFEGSSCGTACTPASTIYSTVVVNGEVIVAGAFTEVCTPAATGYAQCPNEVPADFIFAFDPATGAIDPNFAPVLNTGPVYSLAVGPGNTVYIGGAFSTVNGTSAGGLAQLQVTPGTPSTDGQLVPGFAGQTNGTVTTLAVNGNALYVGGEFGKVDNVFEHVARLNATTGALDTSFAITISNPAPGQTLHVKTMALTPDGNTLAIAGTFLTVNGQSIPRLALISTGGGIGATATLDNFSVPLLANNCSHQHDYINAVAFSPDGSFFVIADTGFKSNTGQGLCDAGARFETGATGTDVQPTWVNYDGADTMRSAVVAGSVVYFGGHDRWANNECGANTVCEANAVLVDGIAAVDANTGVGLAWWHPQSSRGVGVQSLTTFPAGTFPGSDGGLLVGAPVNSIGGSTHDELAMFPLTTTTTPAPGGPIQSGMFSQGRLGTTEENPGGIAAMCVDDANNGSSPGSPAELENCVNDNEQNWTVEPDQTIQVNGLCLDSQGGGTSPGTPVFADTCTGSTSQQWQQGSGETVVNQASGLCLDDPGASTTSGTQLDIATCSGAIQQSWPLPVAQAPPPPPVTGPLWSVLIQPSKSVPCMSRSGSNIEIQNCLGKTNQSWTLEPNGTIQNGGKCLDTAAGGTAPGTVTTLAKCDASATQVWTWTPSSTAPHVNLVQQGSGLCLDDPNGNTANGTQLVIATCGTGNAFQWVLPTY